VEAVEEERQQLLRVLGSIGWIRGRCYHNFGIFSQFSAKNCVFLKYQCYDQPFSKVSFVCSQKRQFFRKNVRRKYLKNQNIGPRFGRNLWT
jgi:hypothetical protein